VTNPFYSSEQTEQSKAVLDALLAAVPDAILIGGWGSWARLGGAMSHDVDVIVTRAELARIEHMVDEVSSSRHLAGTKWRGTWRGIHIDLYVPFQSRLGANLQLRVETLASHTETLQGRRLLTVPAHVASKVAALLDRPDSLPGRKDRQELLGLLDLPGSGGTPAVIKAASTRTAAEVATLIDRAFGFLVGAENLNRHDRARLRQLASQWRLVAGPAVASRDPSNSPHRGVDL
jgi:hypothetical protein